MKGNAALLFFGVTHRVFDAVCFLAQEFRVHGCGAVVERSPATLKIQGSTPGRGKSGVACRKRRHVTALHVYVVAHWWKIRLLD